MTNFNTVNELAERKSENKTLQYVEMARNFALQANKVAEKSESFIITMSAKEVVKYLRKAEAADCEYSAYANAHAAEIWLGKVVNS